MTVRDPMRTPAIVGRRPVLVTGGAGFIGSNIADRLAREGHDVLVYDTLARPGVETNLAWLKKRYPQRISSVIADIRDEQATTDAAAEATAVFHFAAQVAVTTSLAEPREDFDEGLAELAAWVERQTADDRVDEARAELEAKGLVA